MKFPSILISAILIFAFSLAAAAQDDTRVTATWQVEKYDITATLPSSEADRNMTVRTVVNVKNVSGSPASTLSLRLASGAEVSAVTVNGNTADFSKREERINAASALQRLIVRVPSVPAGGSVSATVDYKLNVKENSGLNAISPAGSQFLPLSFWYPTPNSWYFARGADYAPYRLKVTAPGQTVVSSGAESAGSFDQKLAGQPYFVTGNWDVQEMSGVSVYVPKGAGADEKVRAAEIATLASEAKAFVAGLLGPMPDVPLRLAAVKRGAGFSGGGTILVEDSTLRRPKIDSLTAASIAEAVAKIKLGNAVTVAGDGYGTIREGLSRHIANQFIENKYGKDVADVERARQRAAYASVSRRDSPLMLVAPLDDYYFPAVANKGAMVWRILERRVGRDEFYGNVRAAMEDGAIDVRELRNAFASEKALLDPIFDEVTDTDLLVGLPQAGSGETKVALRNTGSVDATVMVEALTQNGETLTARATIPAKSFGEVAFKTPNKIVRAEVDPEKLYPQTDYSDDVAPRESNESDGLLLVKRAFDKQSFAEAEKNARIVLRDLPRFDDVRVLLGRALLAQGKTAEAEKEFRAVLNEKLPTARSMAWANVGLAEVAAKAGQSAQAVKFAEDAIRIDAEYGAGLAARGVRTRLNAANSSDESVKSFFAQFDKAAASNRKADLEALVVPGEIARFAGGISGSTEQWQTQVRSIDRIDADTVLVEANLNIKMLTREPESGTAVYRLTRVGGNWKLSGVDIFEVR